jgi:hypothetical protein
MVDNFNDDFTRPLPGEDVIAAAEKIIKRIKEKP